MWSQNEGCELPVYLFANKCDLLTKVQDSFLAGARMEKTCRESVSYHPPLPSCLWLIFNALALTTALYMTIYMVLYGTKYITRTPTCLCPKRDSALEGMNPFAQY